MGNMRGALHCKDRRPQGVSLKLGPDTANVRTRRGYTSEDIVMSQSIDGEIP